MTVYYPTFDRSVIVPKLIDYAMEAERLDVLKLLHTRNDLKYYLTLNERQDFECYDQEIVYFLYEHARGLASQVKWLGSCSHYRADDYFACAKWLLEHRDELKYEYVEYSLLCAIRHGNFDFVQWVCHECPELQSTRCAHQVAVESGHLEVAKWLYKTFPDTECEDPRYGSVDLETNKWLLSEYTWRSIENRTNWTKLSL